ncbi:acetyltransferase, partial [Bimuria novae-zelandiae CBS 107.79]
LRPAHEPDIPAIGAINAHYVLNTVLTFRYVPPTHEQLLQDFRSVQEEGLPYNVAVESASDTVVGYCYATRFRPPKLGYKPTVELSLYCDPRCVMKGIGSMLMGEVLRRLREVGADKSGEGNKSKGDGAVRNVIACMSVDGTGPGNGMALTRFYERFGFEEVGWLKGVGYK